MERSQVKAYYLVGVASAAAPVRNNLMTITKVETIEEMEMKWELNFFTGEKRLKVVTEAGIEYYSNVPGEYEKAIHPAVIDELGREDYFSGWEDFVATQEAFTCNQKHNYSTRKRSSSSLAESENQAYKKIKAKARLL